MVWGNLEGDDPRSIGGPRRSVGGDVSMLTDCFGASDHADVDIKVGSVAVSDWDFDDLGLPFDGECLAADDSRATNRENRVGIVERSHD